MKILVSDFDGTLYDDKYKENLEYVKSLKDIELIVATGRDHISLFNDFKLESNYYILGDGSYIMNKKKKIIYIKPIKKETCKILKERIKKLKYTKHWFISFNDDVAKLEVKIKDRETAENDLKYMIDGLDDVYGYLSRNWINIIDNNAKKEIAIEYLDSINNYEKIYTVGDGKTDYGMIQKYNGYLITNEKKKEFNCINSFLELKNIIK